MTVRVEPGVVLDQLNAHLKPLGLMFGPDVSTSDRATIGGMIGNNSAGARSLRYGKTVDHVRVGRRRPGRRHAGDLRPARRRRSSTAICAGPIAVGHGPPRGPRHRRRSTAQAIAERFPKILRRVSGYNLDEFVPGLPVRPGRLARRALAVQPGEADRRLGGDAGGRHGGRAQGGADPGGARAWSSSRSRRSRRRSTGWREIVATGPVAVEMLDRMILDLAARTRATRGYLDFAEGRPAAVLAAQFYADSRRGARRPGRRPGPAVRGAARRAGRPQEPGRRRQGRLLEGPQGRVLAADGHGRRRQAGRLRRGHGGRPDAAARRSTTASGRSSHATGSRPPATATPTSAACTSGRSSTSRPSEGVRPLRTIAREVSDLVVEFGGAMSGEHGDGLARSLWNAQAVRPRGLRGASRPSSAPSTPTTG